MKYVWASWDNAAAKPSSDEKKKRSGVKAIKGYGCGVSFTSPDNIEWSSAEATYILDAKGFQATIASA